MTLRAGHRAPRSPVAVRAHASQSVARNAACGTPATTPEPPKGKLARISQAKISTPSAVPENRIRALIMLGLMKFLPSHESAKDTRSS